MKEEQEEGSEDMKEEEEEGRMGQFGRFILRVGNVQEKCGFTVTDIEVQVKQNHGVRSCHTGVRCWHTGVFAQRFVAIFKNAL